MNRTKIEWCDYTWNPVVGCRHRCKYCYAKRLNDRFKWIEDWTKPQFFLTRLTAPGRVKKPSRIFVGSMCDLFGEWVPGSWIHSVIAICEGNPQHTFMFLTKNPVRYAKFNFPENCWLGTTITRMSGRGQFMRYPDLVQNKKNKLFLSFEPLLGPCDDMGTGAFKRDIDLIIVGAQTGPGATPPKKEWIESIKHPNIFYKNNIKKWLN